MGSNLVDKALPYLAHKTIQAEVTLLYYSDRLPLLSHTSAAF